MNKHVDVLAAMRAASRHVPNEQFVEFDAAIDAIRAYEAIVRELAGLQDGLANGNSSAESAATALAERAAELVSTGATP